MRRGLASSRQRARELVEQGAVRVSGSVAERPARLVSASEPVIVVSAAQAFVSRGGSKLDVALAHFGVDVSGRRCLDAGASTGGFTHCLLDRGADTVVAVDVGYGQLDLRLRDDRRVRLLERTNIRALRLADVGGDAFDVVVADLSFISLERVAPVLCGDLARPGAALVVLVKPQFEVGRAEAARARGVIRDPGLRQQALRRAASAFASQGATIMGAMASPVLGPAGNAEFLLHARAHDSPAGSSALPAVVCDWLDDAVDSAPDAATIDAGGR